MTPEVRICPYCGRFLPEEIWKEKSPANQKEDNGSGQVNKGPS